MLHDPIQCPKFALAPVESTLPTGHARGRRPRQLTVGRVASLPYVRRLTLATLIGSTVVAVAGCGSSTMPAAAPFASCLASGLAVEGGQIAVLSIHGASCLTAEHVMTGVIVGLNAGKSIDGAPTLVEGWNCLTYDGNQATCTRGHATLYAQYIRP